MSSGQKDRPVRKRKSFIDLIRESNPSFLSALDESKALLEEMNSNITDSQPPAPGTAPGTAPQCTFQNAVFTRKEALVYEVLRTLNGQPTSQKKLAKQLTLSYSYLRDVIRKLSTMGILKYSQTTIAGRHTTVFNVHDIQYQCHDGNWGVEEPQRVAGGVAPPVAPPVAGGIAPPVAGPVAGAHESQDIVFAAKEALLYEVLRLLEGRPTNQERLAGQLPICYAFVPRSRSSVRWEFFADHRLP